MVRMKMVLFVTSGIVLFAAMLRGETKSASSTYLWKFPVYFTHFQENQKSAPTQRGRVFLKSLLIPGWGQYSLGAKTSARNFFIAELVLWGSALAFHTYGKWLKNDYIDLAAAYAQVDTRNKKDPFWVDVGNFPSIHDYNQEKLRQRNVAALRDPSGPDFWKWDNSANRNTFKNLRIRSDQAFERSSFSVVGVVVNHLISAIHALWVLRKSHQGAYRSRVGYRLVWNTAKGGHGGAISFTIRF